MNSPGIFSLGDLTLTNSDKEGTPITGLAGMRRVSMQCRFAVGVADSSSVAKAILKTSLDQGSTWIAIACIEFTDVNAIRLITVTDVPVNDDIVTPTDSPSDAFVLNGYLGDRLRLDVDLSGADYSENTTLSTRVSVA